MFWEGFGSRTLELFMLFAVLIPGHDGEDDDELMKFVCTGGKLGSYAMARCGSPTLSNHFNANQTITVDLMNGIFACQAEGRVFTAGTIMKSFHPLAQHKGLM
ncbi:hypothetical protein L873DRAFT_292737 [Choiromyces venosus 120613-1]|uniref:Uncharacterized protein n=1 Tax=Choiromyces venosus 120613-1 TaxID=1336337 RepID=A0A3N4IZP9_9PEZI|nr:hypothetical protein L873DRAFT_292737 [Choiromyces venosus 120613-1]